MNQPDRPLTHAGKRKAESARRLELRSLANKIPFAKASVAREQNRLDILLARASELTNHHPE